MKKFIGDRLSLVIAAGSLALLGLLSLIPSGDEPLEGLALIRLLLALTAILALIRIAIPALRKIGGARAGARNRMKVLEMVNLGGRHRAALLSVDGREFLVGMGNDGIRLLAALGEREGEEAEGDHEEFRTLLRRAHPS